MNIAILGAGGHGRVVLDILLQSAGTGEPAPIRPAPPAADGGSQVASRPIAAVSSAGAGGVNSGSAAISAFRASERGASPQNGQAAFSGMHDVIGFLDSNPEIHGRRVDGLPVLGGIEDIPRLRDQSGLEGVIIAIGDNGIRRGYARQVCRMNVELISAIHPSASIAQNAHIGRDTVVAAGVVVCAHCQIGDSVILNTGCIIDHQSMIGEGAHICPGVRIAGRVKVEPGAFVGIGATILPKVTIGYESTVGAGAVVTEDVPDMATVVGVPARQIKRSAADEETAAMLLPARL